ncbi:GntR family transcriptional regulator [Mesorhizobium sp. BR1-1-16]|uniref:GntR family transcriptional regulator n=1 Tax=Mesorhizobium sp. BR1-1-16 TaxID=2876653 RepID=UPI001CCFA7FE|nr:GntR family transcriptional regulator [Mesorhizobium sp. BR1-1-16]MBZ9938797.1 GntR family transcriptional regulator [Mesorhizobium sp. BR1-1-16]HWJ73036.1 GntR family transcriptional regulator [Kaistia sp.]
MAWNDSSLTSGGAPLWHQIAERLRSAIIAGHFKPGDLLPSEAELNRVFGVSRTTARGSLDTLEREGLIVRRSGVGSVVVEPVVELPANVMASFSEDMRRRGHAPTYQTLSAGLAAIPLEVRHILRAPMAKQGFRIHRLLLADAKPIAVSISWIAPRVLAGHKPPTVRELDAGSLYQWLESVCGVRILSGHEVIEARALDLQTAKSLGVDEGTAALVVSRLSESTDRMPVEYAQMTYRGDRYRLRIDI